MEFGIYLNQYGDERAEFTFEDMFEQVDLMEDLGYDTAAVGERHFYEDGFFDVRTCLSALGARTDALDIMSNIVILPIYHPLHLAEHIATLDALTNGRTRWGLSLGYRESELVNFGVAMDDRVGRFLESVEVVKRLLEGERFDHEGRYFSFTDGFVRPKPVQTPRPRFWGGGSSETAIKRAAYRCDGFTAAVTVPETLERDVDRYYDAVEEAGKDPDNADVTIMVDGYVGETTAEAYEALDPYLLDLTAKYLEWGNPEFEGRPGFEDIEDQLAVGTAAEVAERIETYRDIGVDHVIFRTQFPGMDQETALASIRRFGEDVVPQFR
ncbi:LLM class flavin-dependent oxidoreductase [Halegenticoccus tardaugens]|uniref:LLM class flavin-dependent oxidoreductase n=1 Tax=Halegenticoccus tardaugens TaxID=2071624 RepID=UPI00100BA3A6|nr:LLM class flavin-dependent oxidoreductase [Halegenticoccus tardaugens]